MYLYHCQVEEGVQFNTVNQLLDALVNTRLTMDAKVQVTGNEEVRKSFCAAFGRGRRIFPRISIAWSEEHPLCQA